jgi:hypothetical protein
MRVDELENDVLANVLVTRPIVIRVIARSTMRDAFHSQDPTN